MLTDLDTSGVDEQMKPVLRFVGKLTESPSKIVQADVDAIFDAGWKEDSFHFTVMICGLFNFYNRLMDGYGVRNTAEFRQSRGAALADRGYTIVTDTLESRRT
jgi:hypothetical protein